MFSADKFIEPVKECAICKAEHHKHARVSAYDFCEDCKCFSVYRKWDNSITRCENSECKRNHVFEGQLKKFVEDLDTDNENFGHVHEQLYDKNGDMILRPKKRDRNIVFTACNSKHMNQ